MLLSLAARFVRQSAAAVWVAAQLLMSYFFLPERKTLAPGSWAFGRPKTC